MTNIGETFQELSLPVVVMFIVYNIVGFLGNITVIYIYKFRYTKNRFRTLVLWLGIIDLSSCCSTVPMETVSTWFWFNAPSRILCKTKNFFVQFTALSAMFMLFVTAMYKYRQICHPFGKQLTESLIMILCCCGVVMSLTLALPAAILWDVNNHTVTFNNVSQQVDICEVHESFQETVYPALYRHFLSAYSIFLLATIILYIFIAKATIMHIRRMKLRRSKPTGYNNPAFSVDLSESEGTDPNKNETLGKDHISTIDNPKYKASNEKPPRNSQLNPKRIRKVVIMVTIAGVFALTFLIALAFGYVFAVRNITGYNSMSDIVILFCFYRFYFINYSLNPLVYFILDSKFRKHVKASLTCVRSDSPSVTKTNT